MASTQVALSQAANPIEQARAYKRQLETMSLAALASKEQLHSTSIQRTLRLLKLAPEVQALVATGQLSAGQAATLFGIESAEMQIALAGEIVAGGLSVRAAERLVFIRRARSKKNRGVAPRARINLVYASDTQAKPSGYLMTDAVKQARDAFVTAIEESLATCGLSRDDAAARLSSMIASLYNHLEHRAMLLPDRGRMNRRDLFNDRLTSDPSEGDFAIDGYRCHL
jgi:ParB-like chromosome segregation protein Spo0J